LGLNEETSTFKVEKKKEWISGGGNKGRRASMGSE